MNRHCRYTFFLRAKGKSASLRLIFILSSARAPAPSPAILFPFKSERILEKFFSPFLSVYSQQQRSRIFMATFCPFTPDGCRDAWKCIVCNSVRISFYYWSRFARWTFTKIMTHWNCNWMSIVYALLFKCSFDDCITLRCPLHNALITWMCSVGTVGDGWRSESKTENERGAKEHRLRQFQLQKFKLITIFHRSVSRFACCRSRSFSFSSSLYLLRSNKKNQ